MKKILLYSMALIGFFMVSCATAETEQPDLKELNSNEGLVSFRIQTAETRTVLPEDYMIRIYSHEGLIRKYASLEELPQTLSLLEGEYRIDVEVGEPTPVSFTDRYYRGEKPFMVVPGVETAVEVTCPIQNAVVVVNYDETVAANFNPGFETKVTMGDKSLNYTESQLGYFLPSEDLSTLQWAFSGEHPTKGELTAEGELSIESGKRYTLNFTYSPDAPGLLQFTITVEEPSPENGGDVIIFSAEPVIKGLNFSMEEEQKMDGRSCLLSVTAPNAITGLELDIEGIHHDLANETVEGVAIVRKDAKTWEVTLSSELFDAVTGGSHLLQLTAYDSDGGRGVAEMHCLTQGILPVTEADYDLWSNTGKVRVMVFDPAVSRVEVKVRRADGEWKSYPATLEEDQTFVATVATEWTSETKGNGVEVYLPDPASGIFANATYEAKAILEGEEKAAVARFVTHADQPIADSSFENSSLSCFGTNNSNASFWGSGNNTFTSKLCLQDSKAGMDGSACVKMATNYVSLAGGTLAAGNLFTGQFVFNLASTSGTVNYGVPYEWKARPTALRFKYHATVGKVEVVKHTDDSGSYPLQMGEPDIARVYALIVDWSSRHQITSGTGTPSGCFDPETTSSLPCGKIIACASLSIQGNTEGDAMVSVDVPFEYFDQVTKPSSTYQLVISAASNAYGDYMCGCKSNVLYVDDFEWVY